MLCCRKKTKKTSEKIRGVKAVEVDAERGLVSVCGAVDPSVLSQAEGEKCNVQIERMTEPSHNSSGSAGGGHDVGKQHFPYNFYQNEASASSGSPGGGHDVGNQHLQYNFYQNEASARNNSILHLFSDENVNSCSIS